MRKSGLTLDEVKGRISALKGSEIEMIINRGRNKLDIFEARIENIYPSVFTVKVDHKNQLACQTFSYFDVLCGDVEIRGKAE